MHLGLNADNTVDDANAKKLDEVPNEFRGCKSLHSSSKMTTVPDAMAAASGL